MRIKICGITTVEQGLAIAKMGATDIGLICVPGSPRYLSLFKLQELVAQLARPLLGGVHGPHKQGFDVVLFH